MLTSLLYNTTFKLYLYAIQENFFLSYSFAMQHSIKLLYMKLNRISKLSWLFYLSLDNYEKNVICCVWMLFNGQTMVWRNTLHILLNLVHRSIFEEEKFVFQSHLQLTKDKFVKPKKCMQRPRILNQAPRSMILFNVVWSLPYYLRQTNIYYKSKNVIYNILLIKQH